MAKPRLVELEVALPYLRRIDEARIYSNFGPLNAQLEQRLCDHFDLPAGCVVTTNSATMGLTLALQAAASRGGRYCVMPAWTFAATAHAALAAGLTPFLVDVDPTSGALTPGIAWSALARAPGPVAAVLPVAPMGLPADTGAWEEFQLRTGVAVVLDAAAGFDRLAPSAFPSVVSLHATKVLGIGEGGFVACTDPAIISDIRRRANFGFDGSRDATLVGANGKISEYAAAYGLAALDVWPLRRAEQQAVLQYYRAALGDLEQVRFAEGLGEDWVCSTCNIEAPEPAILAIERQLADAEIATRRWWGRGLHGHQAFKDLPGAPTPVTDALAGRTLGLPCWPGIGPGQLDEIAAIVRRAVQHA